MKNKLILSLLLSSLACTFFACDDDEPDPTPSRPTNECSVAKCEGNTVYLCVDGKYKLSENCAYKCEAGKCVTNEPIQPGTSCANGEKRCNGDIPQTCNASGLWVSGDKCLEGQKCENGVCTGTPVVQPDPSKCTNGEQKCEGNKAMVCSGGAFTVNEECAYKCENGVCVDEPVEETLCTGKADGCYCSSALAGANSFCCKGEKVTGEQQCKDSTSFCMADGDAPKCVGCRNSNDCDAATPVCSANVCEAKNAEWCKGKADGYYCRTEDGVDTGFGCDGGNIVQDGWFPPTECNDGNNRVCRASTQGFECVECLGDNDCESGKVCDTRNNTCVIPGGDKNSCPNASFVGSTCYTDPNYFEYVVACDLGNEKSRSKCADDPNGKVCIKDGDDYAFCGCKKDTDCNGYKCQSGNFCKSSCASDSDCAKDYSCQSKKCIKAAEPECTKDSDCKSGFECKNQVCVEKAAEPECTKDSDCKSGFECKNQVCVEKTPAGGDSNFSLTMKASCDAMQKATNGIATCESSDAKNYTIKYENGVTVVLVSSANISGTCNMKKGTGSISVSGVKAGSKVYVTWLLGTDKFDANLLTFDDGVATATAKAKEKSVAQEDAFTVSNGATSFVLTNSTGSNVIQVSKIEIR
ncbi:MAG: hypothetical protein IJ165_09075 [Proteobacteria bacterium]|nr:hypothetical protein [Pseudomonadota bacterium]